MTGTIEQIDAQGHGAYVQVLIFKHFQGGDYFSIG